MMNPSIFPAPLDFWIWSSGSTSWKCAATSNLVFWLLSIIGLCCDHLAATGGPSSFLARHKLQPDRHLRRGERLDLILLAAFNMLFVAPFLCCPLFESAWDRVQGGRRLSDDDGWAWPRELLVNLPLHALVAEAAFYAVHVALHRSAFLYRRVHRVHHRFVAPTAMACVYAHPLEFAAGNIFPIYLGCMLTNAHPATCYGLWFPLAMVGTCRGHCGYRIMGTTDPHDVHHLYFVHNYGGMALLDRAFGTYFHGQKASIIHPKSHKPKFRG